MSRYVVEVEARSGRQIERDAELVLESEYPELLESPGKLPVIDFFDRVLHYRYGLDTGVQDLPEGVEGMTWPDGRVFVSEETYRRAERGDPRARFTIAHEGYHGIKHRRQILDALTDAGLVALCRRSGVKPFRDPEWQANRFAAALLMPCEMVWLIVDGERESRCVEAVASTFGVSRQAAEIRLSTVVTTACA